MAFIHTALRVLNVNRSIAFYEALGFGEVKRDIISSDAVNIRMGLPEDGAEPSLELMFNIGQTQPYEEYGYGHIAISAPDLDAALVELATKGIYPEQLPFSDIKGGTRICFLRDPDGYRVELIGRHKRT